MDDFRSAKINLNKDVLSSGSVAFSQGIHLIPNRFLFRLSPRGVRS